MSTSRFHVIFGTALAALLAAGTPAVSRATMPPSQGPIPSELEAAFEAGLFSGPADAALGTQSAGAVQAQTEWVIPVVLVDFPDQPLATFSTWSHWNRSLFDTTGNVPTGSVFDYYRWVSGRRIRVTGRVVANVRLSQPKGWYANNSWGLGILSTPRNSYGAVDEALRQCDATVDWTPFDQNRDGVVDMLWVVHSGLGGENTVARDNLWSITSSMSSWSMGTAFVTNDRMSSGGLYIRIERFTMLPEISAIRPGQPAEIGVFCHEFGHALGLPDLYDTTGGTRNVGPGNWSLMSTGGYGGDGQSPESPTHLGGWASVFMGWNPMLRVTRDSTLAVAALQDGGPVYSVWFQGENQPEHFVLEHRRRTGFDARLPAEGMILHQLDDVLIGVRVSGNRINAGPTPALRLIEADGRSELMTGQSRGDASDAFPGPLGVTLVDDRTSPNLRALNGTYTHTALENIRVDGESLRVFVRVQPMGWQAARGLPGPHGIPTGGQAPARRAVRLPTGGISTVTSESRGGNSLIAYRGRSGSGEWMTPEVVNTSAASALEPTVAPLGGSDVAVVWSDTRDGAYELYYRVRRQGAWMPETRLTDLPGSSRYPAVVADGSGGIHLAWLYTPPAANPLVYYSHLGSGVPLLSPIPISADTARPDAPMLAAAPDGGCYVLWPERVNQPTRLWVAPLHPDTGVSPRRRLTPVDGTTQATAAPVVDANGTLHVLWPVTVSGRNEIHYHRAPDYTGPYGVPDSVLEQRPETIQNLSFELDAWGGMHATFEGVVGGVPQVRYRRRTHDSIWDVSSTLLSEPEDGYPSRLMLIPEHEEAVTLLYAAGTAAAPTWLARHRDAFPARGPTSAGEPSRVPAPAWLRAHPNPVRAGAMLTLRWSGARAPRSGAVSFYDVAGRRLGRVAFEEVGGERLARLTAADVAGWRSGLVFARVDGEAAAIRIAVLR